MLHISENYVCQTLPGFEKTWRIPELLETPDPLPGEPLPERNAVFREIIPAAAELFSELSPAARLCYDFWKQLMPQRIAERHFKYETKVSQTYRWELTINPEGLFYKDLSVQYSQMPGTVHEQLFSEFWFYGPLMPLPDLDARKWLVALIRNAFLQAGSPASYKHFPLFEYPPAQISPSQWADGDASASDFVTLRPFGIEHGRQNWHDGLVHLSFLSFERFLSLPPENLRFLAPETQADLKEYLVQNSPPKPARPSLADNSLSLAAYGDFDVKPPGNEVSKQLFMDNGGREHYIYLDGHGDDYHATESEKAAWRKELIEFYTRRLHEEDNVSTLVFLAKSLQYNGAENVETLLLEAAESADPKRKQAIAEALGEVFNNHKVL